MELFLENNRNNFSIFQSIKSVLRCGEVEGLPPSFSFLVPTYNRPLLLKETIDSILAQNGNYKYEIIVVDNDGIIDEITETEKLVNSYSDSRILYYKNSTNIGIVGNWNRCIELSRGDYITILHDDDWIEADYLHSVFENIRGKQSLFFKYSIADERPFSNKKKNIGKVIIKKCVSFFVKEKHPISTKDFFFGNMAAGTLGIVYKRECVIEMGGFDERYFPSQDYVFNIMYNKSYGSIFVRKCLMHWRISVNQSMALAKLSPFAAYEIRGQISNYFSKNNKMIDLVRVSLFDYDKKHVEKDWKINVDLVQEIENKKGLGYNILSKFIELFVYFRYIYLYVL